MERSGWLRHHLAKALAMHLADEVWQTTSRHLFPDATGKRYGRPRVGSWWTSTRICGRARSHTTDRKWETFRLVGSLAAHRAHSGRRDIPVKPSGISGWWAYDGPLTVVFSGTYDLVLPVKIPTAPGQQPRLDHSLGKPQLWHKIDLVRIADRKAPGGWRVYAHLMILGPGWCSPAVTAARAAVPRDRVGGVDGNVSNLAVVSMPADPAIPGGIRADLLTVTPEQRATAQRSAKKARDRQRAMDRSRRATNATQYHPSKRAQERADRRANGGLRVKEVTTPTGSRVTDKAGVPRQRYRDDVLSPSYRRTRAEHGAAARSASQAKHSRARQFAHKIVVGHGNHLVIEHTNIGSWTRLWGRGTALFAPGMLIAAIRAECAAAGGRLLRAGTTQTALSQQCPCGHRAKKPLSQRRHACLACGLRGHRDLVAAAMAACVKLADEDQPSTAYIDEGSRRALARRVTGQQEALVRSTATTRIRDPAVPAGAAADPPRRPLPDERDSTEASHPPMTGTTARPCRDAEPLARHGPESPVLRLNS